MKIELPESFKLEMKRILKGEYDAFLASYDERHHAGLRVNRLKLTPERFCELSPYEIKPVPFVDNGFYYDESLQPARHPYYYAGLYYIQEPSAMTPASVLPVKPGHRVLDLCAAPGGKSTELAARLQGEGVLVSNDISNSRAKALLKNLEIFGTKNAIIVSEDPAKLETRFEGYFDRILVDAPCSGEGMFRKQPSIIKNWEQYGVDYYNRLQLQILPSAIRMLRPGGYLVYSTCTFSALEDEGTLKHILEEFPEMHVVPMYAENGDDTETGGISLRVFPDGFCHAMPELVDGPSEISNAVRLFPHRIEGEGHFVALLRKDGDESCEDPGSSVVNRGQNQGRLKIADETIEFFSHVDAKIDLGRVISREGRLYMLPDDIPDLSGLRILRSGLLLGEEKKMRFEPSQALAMALRADEYDNCYDIAASDPDAIRYLKCESVNLPDYVKGGWCLVTCGGYPLGWGKASGGKLKNKYLPGWRWM